MFGVRKAGNKSLGKHRLVLQMLAEESQMNPFSSLITKTAPADYGQLCDLLEQQSELLEEQNAVLAKQLEILSRLLEFVEASIIMGELLSGQPIKMKQGNGPCGN